MTKYAVIAASHNEEILRSSLLASPDLAARAEVSVQRGASSAGTAYNRGIQATQSKVMIFLHQDVYLPAGWFDKVDAALAWLGKHDPNWGLAGAFGTEPDGTGQGRIYSTGLQRVLGEEFTGGREVETLDEVVLILRRSSGLKFDEQLPGFHMYGADICLQAAERGMRSYAISACCVHNTNGIGMLPRAYWKCYELLRRKWRKRLPVSTPCMPITKWGGPALRYLVKRPITLALGGQRPGRRVANPARVWQELAVTGKVSQSP